ncbi:MAG: LytTR family DNA-binding domain-containing protein [Raineya sp.]|jgi:two-component system LytT family response regulator|nr:LytTR family DNA-binding domain-containing protein [Raineya sp.]
MMPFRTILIDDEKLALNRLKRLLSDFTDTVEIIGEASNGEEGHLIIEKEQPDLIFLDIEMPILNGFEMLQKLEKMPLVVFATAYDQYAIKAFEENSIDYLLKPIEKERLELTIKKLEKIVQNQSHKTSQENENLLKLLQQIKPQKELNSISVKTGDKIILLRLEDITHFEAEDKYTFIYTQEGKKHILDYTITYLEQKLPDHFIRVSRSTIVNKNQIAELQKHFSGKYILTLSDKNRTKIETGLKFGDNIKTLLYI